MIIREQKKDYNYIPLSVLKRLLRTPQTFKVDFLKELFKESKRIYIPLKHIDGEIEYLDSVSKFQVTHSLSVLGYTLYDYKKGLCKKDGDPKNLYKIGKVLFKNNHHIILKKFNEDVTRSNININFNDLEIVISSHPFDIAMMSTGRGWSSCMRYQDDLASDFHRHITDDISNGMLICYIINKNDRRIHNPKARFTIKPYYSNRTGKTYYKISNMIYGLSVKSFKDTVQEWIDSWQHNIIDCTHIRSYDFYIDEGDPGYLFPGDKITDSEIAELKEIYGIYKKGDMNATDKSILIAGFPEKNFPIKLDYIRGNIEVYKNIVINNFNFLKGAEVLGNTYVTFNRKSIKNFIGLEGVRFRGNFQFSKNMYFDSFSGLNNCIFDKEFRFSFNSLIVDFRKTHGNVFNGDFIFDGNSIMSYEGIEDFDLTNAHLKLTSIFHDNFSILATLPVDLKVRDITTCHFVDINEQIRRENIIYHSQQEITDSDLTLLELKLKWNKMERSEWDKHQLIKRYNNHVFLEEVLEIIGE